MTDPSSTHLACRTCSAPITKKPGGGKPAYCPDCAKERTRIANRDYQRRRRAGSGRLGPRTHICQDCNGEFSGGPLAERCPSCRVTFLDNYQDAYSRARGHLKAGTSITVICECGSPFEWMVVIGRRARIGCNSAKRSRYMPRGEQLALVG